MVETHFRSAMVIWLASASTIPHPSSVQLTTGLHPTRSGTLLPLASPLPAHAALRLQGGRPYSATSLGRLALSGPHPRSAKHVVDAAAGHSFDPDTSNAANQASPARLEPTLSSSDNGTSQVMTSAQEPSLQQQQQQQIPGTSALTQPWSAPLVILGVDALQKAADSLLTYALPWLDTLLEASSDGRYFAVRSLAWHLLVLAFTAGSLALWCRWHRTSVAAFLMPGLKQPRVALREGFVAAGMSSIAAHFTYSVCSIALLIRSSAPSLYGRGFWTSSEDVRETILQSGDPLAVVMWEVSRVIVGPVWEELLYRGIALQCLVTAFPKLAPVMLVLTSVWFGAAHMQYTLASKAAVAANGLCWGYHYLATGRNILVPICAHVVANLIAALDEFRRSLM